MKHTSYKELFLLPEYLKYQKVAFHFLCQDLYAEIIPVVDDSSY